MSAIIVTQDLTHYAKGEPIFYGLNLSVQEGEKIGLIGPNGAGKSTLLRLFTGLMEPDGGAVVSRRDLKLGFVQQSDTFPEGSSIITVLEKSTEESGVSPIVIPQWIGKAGFADKNILTSALSGGWKKKLSLTAALIREPDLLLLDEPTNHLDIDGIEWLEDILKNFRQTLITVSHDRYFLENICSRIIEIDDRYPQGAFAAEGAYSDFVEKREEFFQARTQYRDSLANKVRRETAWLRAGVKARTTKSKYRQEQAYQLTDELKGIKIDRQKIDISYSESGRKTKDLLEAENISKNIGERTLFKNFSIVIKSGMRLGIAGANGCGKTTLIKTLLGELAADSGRIKKANNLRTGVLEQDRSSLDPSITLRQALCPHGDSVVYNNQSIHIAAWSKRFLFRNEQLSQPVSSLSGGEQARVLIARAMCLTADILVMDEPTNDLDIATLEMLEESLLEFAGSVIFISHDRSFLDRVATSVIGFLDNGEIGLFADYHQWEDARSSQQDQAAKEDANSIEGVKLTKEERKELVQIEKQIEKTEKKIMDLQLKLSEASMEKSLSKITDLSNKIENEQKGLNDLLKRWEELEERR